jgi:hypothetical protein
MSDSALIKDGAAHAGSEKKISVAINSPSINLGQGHRSEKGRVLFMLFSRRPSSVERRCY